MDCNILKHTINLNEIQLAVEVGMATSELLFIFLPCSSFSLTAVCFLSVKTTSLFSFLLMCSKYG